MHRMLALLNAELPEGMRDSPLVRAVAEQMGGELERLHALGRMPDPPVFRDWRSEQGTDLRVSTFAGPAGPGVEMFHGETAPGGGMIWHRVELTEDDACLLAASLLQRAEREDLAELVLRGLAEPPE